MPPSDKIITQHTFCALHIKMVFITKVLDLASSGPGLWTVAQGVLLLKSENGTFTGGKKQPVVG